jgi:hypothetical protein
MQSALIPMTSIWLGYIQTNVLISEVDMNRGRTLMASAGALILILLALPTGLIAQTKVVRRRILTASQGRPAGQSGAQQAERQLPF